MPGNNILVVDRNTPLDAGVFKNCAGVLAVNHRAVDHRIVDVGAAPKMRFWRRMHIPDLMVP